MSVDLQKIEHDAFLARAETLAQLVAFPAWSAWESLLVDMRKGLVEELVSATDAGEIRFLQGAASVLGEILERPHRISATASAFLRTEEDEKRVYRPELRSVVGAGFDEGGEV